MSGSSLARVHLFPVRHHSPRSTAMLRAFLERVRPKVVLVEGPCDADPLVDVLVDAKTEPPIAILGYATEGEPRSALWPFAAYSPEWQALRWAAEHEVTARFIDVPVGVSLAHDRASEEHEGEPYEDEGEERGEHEARAEPRFDPHQAAAEARGLRGFEELWEACFEAPAYEPQQFREALLAHAALVREAHPVRWHRARDAFMAARIEAIVAGGEGVDGVDPERIVAVVGAAHAAAFVAGDVDPALLSTLPEARPAATTVIPYSFPRLAAQLGYGAGNRAPQYYQLAHEAGCDFRQATLRALLGFGAELRSRGFAASMADTIEAYRLARALADLRDKPEPGLDEVREACIATLCHGDAGPVDAFLWRGMLGHRVGRVAERIGKNSLQEEFWREVDERALPRDDEPTEVALLLREPRAVETSVFLHRLRVAGVPYASYQGTYKDRAVRRGEVDEAGGVDALGRMRESWMAQWTPSTDIALVERIALGSTLQQVTDQVLGQRLEEATGTADAASVLLEAVVTVCPRPAADAMRACDRLAATDDDLPSLARACMSLSGLVSYGSSRDVLMGGGSKATLDALCRKTFDRAVLRLRPACTGDDDAVAEIPRALQTLHDVALSQPGVDRDVWLRAAAELVEDYSIHPRAAGVATALLYLARHVSEDDVAIYVGQRLSDTLHPQAGAAYLEGFLQINAMVLVKNRAIVETLDAWVCEVEPETFRNILPLLRRVFGALGPTERRTFLENLINARGLGDRAAAAATVITTTDEAVLAEVSDDLDLALDDLDDLL
ncbi:DUF5682 family protein [Paraliomyxa miuraensis]|uniref:DUF5682 family protein n=1 Tax=Paraliomyxa miuraensis TaxID=376150 RepID=UPI0022546A2B|nr:DUF5682 family protein [Paraliomyxa miuraensis]MCX4246532.1 DUF5682 family protein [Paraliomyxa miuraensis]